MRTKLILISVLLSSCSYLHTPVLTPYKMDIRQGNFITPEMRDKLKFGMSRQQVRYVMGTPMISDAFHGNRWDYVYRLEHRSEIVEKQRLTLLFDGDRLVRIDDGKTVQTAPPEALVPVAAEASKPEVKADPAAEVLNSVQGWAAAWSDKNARNYLAAYTPDFAPQGMTHDAWEKQRVERISKPKVIEVVLDNASVTVQDDSHATASFTQSYRSDAYHDQMEKTLHLVRQSDHWLIAEELAGKAVKTRAVAKVGKPAAGAQPVGGDEAAVRDAVKHWAEVWSARDAEKYLASYADGFKPSGMSKAAWEAQRKERIGKAASIAVEVSDLNVNLRDASHAGATFKQGYRSDTHQDEMRKTLQLEKVGDAWLIVSEQAAR